MSDLLEKINEIFEEDINPSLAMHAGSATVKNVWEESGVVKVTIEFHGGCAGCTSSQDATLEGIQNYLREELEKEDLEVLKED